MAISVKLGKHESSISSKETMEIVNAFLKVRLRELGTCLRDALKVYTDEDKITHYRFTTFNGNLLDFQVEHVEP